MLEDWRKSVICPIYKKGDRTACENYRGIALMSHVRKLCERVLEERLRGHVEEMLGEFQYGFRPRRTAIDLIFTLKMISEKSWVLN